MKNGLVFTTVRAAQALFCLNAFIWLAFGAITLLRMANRNPDQVVVPAIIALLMVGNAAAMLAAAWLLGKRRRLSLVFALVVLLVNILLTFTDQVGFFDLSTLLVDLLILALLLVNRKQFSRRSNPLYN